MKVSTRLRGRLRRNDGPTISCDDVVVGAGSTFGKDIVIKSDRVRIGDGCRIGNGVRIDSTVFELGDYATIYPDCFFPGPGALTIGHNFWLGTGAIIDAQGGTTIGDNVGVGAGSQLWTHIKFGDVMFGARFHSEGPLIIGNDVWLVGHCLVSPVTIEDRAMAMLGSVIVKDIAADRTYAGSPAKDMTDVFGPQFHETTAESRHAFLTARMSEFRARGEDHEAYCRAIGHDFADTGPVFEPTTRRYRKLGTPMEREFMRFLLPDAKFTPA